QHTIQMVGISESILEQNNALLLFPNPAINKLSLQVSNSAIKAIKIYTITGQQVFEKQAALNNQTECTIDVSQLHFGLYQCVVELNNGSTITKRWIKE
ncbi:MAG: T9SS type A sorting domain-containing protein, partial [Bacteroidia bacterium]|nr:T9SS type A sorting domain-containing protein [Bacteroidia bacterium]